MLWAAARPTVASDTNSFAEFYAIPPVRSARDRQSPVENYRRAKGHQPLSRLQMLCCTGPKAAVPATHYLTRRGQTNQVRQSAPGNNYLDRRNERAHESAMRFRRSFLGCLTL